MKIFKLLNPQGWIGQIIVLLFFVAVGVIVGLRMQEPCPPTTQVNLDQKIKGKKGAVITSDLTNIQSQTDCTEWLRGLSKKEIKDIRK